MRGTIGTILKFILREKIIKTIGDGLTCTLYVNDDPGLYIKP